MTPPGTDACSAKDLFTRDGHLTMLTFDRFECGELSVPRVEAVHTHLLGCESCSDEWEKMLESDVALSPPPEPLNVPTTPSRSSSRWGSAALGATMAIAATAILAHSLHPQHASRAPTDEGHLSAASYTSTTFEAAEREHLELEPLTVRVWVEGRIVDLETERIPWDEGLRIEAEVASPGFMVVSLDTTANALTQLDDDEAWPDEGGTGSLDSDHAWTPLSEVVEVDGRAPWVFDYAPQRRRSAEMPARRLWVTWCPTEFGLDDLDGSAPDCSSQPIELQRNRRAPASSAANSAVNSADS